MCCVVGSSPRGRGKLVLCATVLVLFGLIPAWAGKTYTTCKKKHLQAHPRVGGENPHERRRPGACGGSSPRGRGKPSGKRSLCGALRLIPAWAGKTCAVPTSRRRRRAHPRVGGENCQPQTKAQTPAGSSPRGRGKHFLTCAFIERIGQILETLELAVSSESYTLSAAYATDAPQDQARNTALVLPSSRAAS